MGSLELATFTTLVLFYTSTGGRRAPALPAEGNTSAVNLPSPAGLTNSVAKLRAQRACKPPMAAVFDGVSPAKTPLRQPSPSAKFPCCKMDWARVWVPTRDRCEFRPALLLCSGVARGATNIIITAFSTITTCPPVSQRYNSEKWPRRGRRNENFFTHGIDNPPGTVYNRLCFR